MELNVLLRQRGVSSGCTTTLLLTMEWQCWPDEKRAPAFERWARAIHDASLDDTLQLCWQTTATLLPSSEGGEAPAPAVQALLVLGTIPSSAVAVAGPLLESIREAVPDVILQTGVVDVGQEPVPAPMLRAAFSRLFFAHAYSRW